MSKQSSTALFDLIRKLTKSEKRYFKLYAGMTSKQDKPAYVELFDLIEAQDEYDEERILQQAERIKATQLPNQKKYLYDQILQSLVNFEFTADAEKKVQAHLQFVRILFKKRLLQQCAKQVLLGKKIAEKYELYNPLLELLQWEGRLHVMGVDLNPSQANKKKEKNRSLTINDELQEIMELYRKQTQLEFLRNQVYISMRDERFSRKEFDLINNRTLEDQIAYHVGVNQTGFRNQYLYNVTLGIYYITLGNYGRSYTYFKTIVELIEQNMQFTELESNIYPSALYNFALNSIRVFRFDDFFEGVLIKLLSEIKKGSLFKESLYCLELISQSTRGDFKEGKRVAERVIAEINENGIQSNIVIEIDMYYDIAYIYFGNGEYEEALEWINKIINNKAASGIVTDLYTIALLVQIIIHYELGNYFLLESLITSADRFMKARNRRYKFEREMLKLFKALEKAANKKERVEQFKKIKDRIRELSKDPYERRVLEYFDFISWFNSKIKNKPFDYLVEEYFKKVEGGDRIMNFNAAEE